MVCFSFPAHELLSCNLEVGHLKKKKEYFYELSFCLFVEFLRQNIKSQKGAEHHPLSNADLQQMENGHRDVRFVEHHTVDLTPCTQVVIKIPIACDSEVLPDVSVSCFFRRTKSHLDYEAVASNSQKEHILKKFLDECPFVQLPLNRTVIEPEGVVCL